MEQTEFELGDLLSYEQPTQYIVESTEYNDAYKIPVLTAGKSFILGYTNEITGIFNKLPVIIFDDFTTSSQFVNFQFKVKSSAMKILNPNLELVLPKFIYYKMQMIDFDHGTHKRYWIQQYSKIKVQIPSIPRQETILLKIEELFSELDKGVETLITIKKQLEVYRQAVLKNAFRNSQRIKTNEVCVHITDGDHMPPPKAQVGIPFVMISNIKGNQIDWENTHFVDSDYYSQIGEKRTPCIGDVLYTVTGSFGIPVLVDFNQKFCFQRHIALLRPNTSISQKFLYYALQTPDVLQQAAHRATGTAQKTVGLAVLRDLDIPFEEGLHEQNHIVSRIESQLSLYDSILKTVNSALEQADTMRKSILKQAFEGRLINE